MKSRVKMKAVVFLMLVGFFLQDSTAVLHSLKYFHTASCEVPNFPEFVAVGLVDDLQMIHYDSNTTRVEPKQDWMNKVTGDRADYWDWQTGLALDDQQWSKAHIEIAKERFNQTGGVHILQNINGCELDDETNEINGFWQYGYDGEDFLVFDTKIMTWVAPQQQAVLTKEKLNNNKAFLEYLKNYVTNECPGWLKKYVEYGKSSLMRKDLPTVSLLQKDPSSRITCHATGFYPNQADMFWRKDGEELHDKMEKGEVLPNHDGSFQMSVDLELPSDDWGKYECVFQLSGEKKHLVTKLDKKDIKTNYVNPTNINPGIIIAGVLIVIIICVAGFFIWKNRSTERPPSPVNGPAVQQVEQQPLNEKA